MHVCVNLGKFVVGAFERFNALRVDHFDPEVGTALDELGLVVGRLGIYCWSALQQKTYSSTLTTKKTTRA